MPPSLLSWLGARVARTEEWRGVAVPEVRCRVVPEVGARGDERCLTGGVPVVGTR